jgi:hypothetical protein
MTLVLSLLYRTLDFRPPSDERSPAGWLDIIVWFRLPTRRTNMIILQQLDSAGLSSSAFGIWYYFFLMYIWRVVGVALIIHAYTRVHVSSYRVPVSPAVVTRHEPTAGTHLAWSLHVRHDASPPPLADLRPTST